ncbi:hypothetical protein chiPu_0001634 [Chiloscyllium punctatum]|uniref:GPR128 GAIN subdomain A domain-containing protein n=1 Tax=Chiloscyllium punctatum TaxID=137246 RepID=A0A401RYS7_CHIPU|nr:hypothetical protein [Chiloscyllium punctatum]
MVDGSPLATRQCVLNNGNLSLTEPVLFDCSKSLQSILDDLTTLNITTAASATLVLTSKPQSLTVKDVTTTTHILSKIMQDPTQLKQEDSIYSIKTFCNILEVKQDIIIEVQEKLSSLADYVENMTRFVDLDQECSQMAVRSNRADSTKHVNGLGVVSYQMPDAQFGFILYKDALFFPTPKKKDSYVMKTQVISAVVNEPTKSLTSPVTIKLRKKQMERSYFAVVSIGVAWGVPALIAIITISVTQPKRLYRQKEM